MITLPSGFQKRALVKTYWLVRLTGATTTFRWSSGADVGVEDESYSYDGGRLATDFLDEISTSCDVLLQGGIQQTLELQLRLVNRDNYHTILTESEILHRRIEIGIAQENPIEEDVSELWLVDAVVTGYEADLEQGLLSIFVSSERNSVYTTDFPSQTLQDPGWRYSAIPGVTQVVPVLYGDWRSDLFDMTVFDPVFEHYSQYLFENRHSVSLVLLSQKNNILGQTVFLFGDHTLSDDTNASILYFVSGINRYATFGYALDDFEIVSDSEIGYPSDLAYLRSTSIDQVVLVSYSPTGVFTPADGADAAYENVAANPENVYDRQVETYAEMHGNDAAIGTIDSAYAHCGSFTFPYVMSQDTLVAESVLVHACIELVGDFAGNGESVKVRLMKTVAGSADDVIATSASITSTPDREDGILLVYEEGSDTEVIEDMYANPQDYYISVIWLHPSSLTGNSNFRVRIYSLSMGFGTTIPVDDEAYTKHAELSRKHRYIPTPFRRSVAGLQHAKSIIIEDYRMAENAIIHSELPLSNTSLSICTEGRPFGAWIGSRGGYTSGDIIPVHAYIIEDILRNYVGISATYIDTDSIDAAGHGTTGTRKDIRAYIQHTEQADVTAVLAALATESASLLTFRADRTAKLVSLDYTNPDVRTITPDHLRQDYRGRISSLSSTFLFDSVRMRYALNYNTSKYDKELFLNPAEFSLYRLWVSTDAIAQTDTRAGTPDTFTGLADAANTRLNRTREFLLETSTIRDDASALVLFKWLADWLLQERQIIELDTVYWSCVDLELGDPVSVSIPEYSGRAIVIGKTVHVTSDHVSLVLLTINPHS